LRWSSCPASSILLLERVNGAPHLTHDLFGGFVAAVLLLTSSRVGSADVLPGLALLPHDVRIAPPEVSALLDAPSVDAVVLDARRDLVGARGLARLLRTTGLSVPLFAVLTEGGLVAVAADWGVDDVLLSTAGPAEIDARLRLAAGRAKLERTARDAAVRVGELTIDEATYSAKLRGEALELTFKEFELLKFLAQHPGRVFTRAQLLQEVWGYDYYGGTRTVDVHVRRLRAKLGTEHESLIGTVRHVGYKFVTPPVEPIPEQATVDA
jgi:DNA-binding response OmpR family regulator